VTRFSFVAASPLIALLFGCGGGMQGAPAPAAPEPAPEAPAAEQAEPSASESAPSSLDRDEGPPLTTLQAAETEFARVERQLDALWTPAAPSASPAPEAPGKAGSEAQQPEAKASDDLALRCETACKAFLSLERAAAAICRLGGEADARCTRAKSTVEKNRQRISECACS
jgi:hypothetical protein